MTSSKPLKVNSVIIPGLEGRSPSHGKNGNARSSARKKQATTPKAKETKSQQAPRTPQAGSVVAAARVRKRWSIVDICSKAGCFGCVCLVLAVVTIFGRIDSSSDKGRHGMGQLSHSVLDSNRKTAARASLDEFPSSAGRSRGRSGDSKSRNKPPPTGDDQKPELHCFDGAWPAHIEESLTEEVDDSSIRYNYASIVFSGKCLLDAYKRIAEDYKGIASAWRFVKTSKAPEVVLKHRDEDAVTFAGNELGPGYEELESFILNGATPLVGQLTPDAVRRYGDFLSPKVELVLGLFSPDMDIDSVYRPMLMDVAERFTDPHLTRSHHIAYIDVQAHRAWVESEFRVTSFPAIAVFRKFPGIPSVYNGELKSETILQFIRDVDDGCVDHTRRDASYLFTGRSSSPAASMCDSLSVLGGSEGSTTSAAKAGSFS
jgi:hypothetical protein